MAWLLLAFYFQEEVDLRDFKCSFPSIERVCLKIPPLRGQQSEPVVHLIALNSVFLFFD